MRTNWQLAIEKVILPEKIPVKKGFVKSELISSANTIKPQQVSDQLRLQSFCNSM